jgi:hypothetical protein
MRTWMDGGKPGTGVFGAQGGEVGDFGDEVLLVSLGVVAALAAVTLVNTLAVATFERRRSVRLLARTGATAGQVAGMFGWQALPGRPAAGHLPARHGRAGRLRVV